MDEDEALMTLGFLLIRKRRRQRNKQKIIGVNLYFYNF